MVMYMSFKINKFNSDVDMLRTDDSLSFSLYKKRFLKQLDILPFTCYFI